MIITRIDQIIMDNKNSSLIFHPSNETDETSFRFRITWIFSVFSLYVYFLDML